MLRILFILILIILLIAAFTGIKPFSDWKDTAFNKVSEWWQSLFDATNNATTTGTLAVATTSTVNTNSIIPETQTYTTQEQEALLIGKEVVSIVNDIRVERGSSQLLWDETLYKYSIGHSNAMAQKRELFHSDINLPYAENAWGGEGSKSWGAETIVNSWMNSPKHRTWLLCPNLRHVAVGVAYSSNGMYASWTFWRSETTDSDWWYQYTPDNPPTWWYWEE